MNAQTLAALEALRQYHAFAALTLDGYRWLLPQVEVHSLEPLSDIDPEVRAPLSIGAISLADEWWPVYCFSGELQLLPQVPTQRRVCVLLDNGGDRFALTCDQIETLNPPPPLSALPASMVAQHSPTCALTLLKAGLGCVTDTERLAVWLSGFLEKAETDG